jgi:Phage late-transcription coactivator
MREDVAKFSILIEEIVKKTGLTYMEAVIEHCEQSGIEIDVGARLLSPALKSKIFTEASALNFLPKTETSKLPL